MTTAVSASDAARYFRTVLTLASMFALIAAATLVFFLHGPERPELPLGTWELIGIVFALVLLQDVFRNQLPDWAQFALITLSIAALMSLAIVEFPERNLIDFMSLGFLASITVVLTLLGSVHHANKVGSGEGSMYLAFGAILAPTALAIVQGNPILMSLLLAGLAIFVLVRTMYKMTRVLTSGPRRADGPVGEATGLVYDGFAIFILLNHLA